MPINIRVVPECEMFSDYTLERVIQLLMVKDNVRNIKVNGQGYIIGAEALLGEYNGCMRITTSLEIISIWVANPSD